MPTERRRPGVVLPIAGIVTINFNCAVFASQQTDPTVWWMVASVAVFSVVCIATLLAAHRRR